MTELGWRFHYLSAAMKKLFFALLGLALPHLTWAQLVTFNATLTGSQETPPNSSPAMGWATATLDTATSEFSVDLTFSGLVATETAAHLHFAPLGSPGPVVLPLPLGSSVHVTTMLDATSVNELMQGLWYANVHSTVYRAGEIRGQLLPVPEPSTYALAGVLLLGVAAAVRRRRRS